MHKITKGLKKKKKGKKSKHKEEELFKPEELEEYRKEHQSAAVGDSSEKNEEWKKFLALTSGVDDILKKTQGDLDRIKSTSFFQRKPTESEVQKQEEKLKQIEQQAKKEEGKQEEVTVQLGIVEVSESESEEEDEDIFDTAYIDVIATGEVKLAYIPESPTDKLEGDDPFDTSIAERAILGPETERKGKKLVPIGAAVEVLTGRVQLPTCASKRTINKRQILKQPDLLLDSFDDTSNIPNVDALPEEVPKTLLDDDSIPPCGSVDLNSLPPIHIINIVSIAKGEENSDSSKDINEKVILNINEFEDPEDSEFEALAAESLSKPVNVLETLPVYISEPAKDWNAFNEKDISDIKDDPFDTSFAENVLPVNATDSKIKSDLINGSNSLIQKNSILEENRIPENELNTIKPIHRDLLGGSITDLTITNSSPDIKSNQELPANHFSASVTNFEDDDDFDPRADENAKPRPDVLDISSVKTVSFDITSPQQSDLLGTCEGGKNIKPLTPFYVRKNSVPQLPLEDDSSDPFDTSFALNIAPGKAELRVIETELFDPDTEKQLSLVDNDFDPRDDKKAERDKVVGFIRDITNPKSSKKEEETVDLLAINDNISAKVLTPEGDKSQDFTELSYSDPFDTTKIAANTLPGKTELKLLEFELIDPSANLNLGKPLDDLLEDHHDIISHQPLSPAGDCCGSSAINNQEDFDPFDTSIANNIQPGKAELKLLESELI